MTTSPLEPDWDDIPESDEVEPADAGGDHDGIPADQEVGQ